MGVQKYDYQTDYFLSLIKFTKGIGCYSYLEFDHRGNLWMLLIRLFPRIKYNEQVRAMHLNNYLYKDSDPITSFLYHPPRSDMGHHAKR